MMIFSDSFGKDSTFPLQTKVRLVFGFGTQLAGQVSPHLSEPLTRPTELTQTPSPRGICAWGSLEEYLRDIYIYNLYIHISYVLYTYCVCSISTSIIWLSYVYMIWYIGIYIIHMYSYVYIYVYIDIYTKQIHAHMDLQLHWLQMWHMQEQPAYFPFTSDMGPK